MNHLRRTLEACRGAFVALAAFSAGVNLLMLTAPLYMLQVFDRVLTSRSVDTLLALSFIACLALVTLALLEAVRSIALVRVSTWLDVRLGRAALEASVAGTLRPSRPPASSGQEPAQSLRDLAVFRAYVAGPSMFPIMDAPWSPLFVAVIFLLHPLLGWMAVGGALALLGLAVANERFTRGLVERASAAQSQAMQQAQSAVRNADVIAAMGMMSNLAERWNQRNTEAIELQANAGVVSGMLGSVSKFVRLALQIGMLGAGAWLTIQNKLTPGGMIAATILLGRALAPVDQAINSWRGLVGAREAYSRLKSVLTDLPERKPAMPLPRPRGELACEDVTYRHGTVPEPALRSVSFRLPAGKTMGIIGPTAAGKTTLARLLVGIVEPRLGHVRLDGMDVCEWYAPDRGRYIGYLPQEIKLFAGTVRENIARMADGDPDEVIATAKLAGVHELILRLPQGYETQVGDGGSALAGGQRQRIALARALYGNPSLVVLDEPNANLDQPGVEALLRTIDVLKRQGTSLVIVAHQPSLMQQVDYLLALGDGAVKLCGPRAEVIARVTGPQPKPDTSAEQGGTRG